MAFLIDMDIIIYSLKGHEKVQSWMLKNQNIPKFISVITYGELTYGARKSKFQEKNNADRRLRAIKRSTERCSVQSPKALQVRQKNIQKE